MQIDGIRCEPLELWLRRLDGCERLEAGPECPGLQLQLSEIRAG